MLLVYVFTMLFIIILECHLLYIKKLTVKQPQAGPLGDTAGEGTVIIGDDSFIHVITPEDFQVGQNMEVINSDIDDPDPV